MSVEKGEKVYSMPLHDMRRHSKYTVKHPPSVHIARGFRRHLPFLSEGRPIICISDWQYETDTQQHFWEQAKLILQGELGEDAMARSIVLVAGDMASSDDALRGSASDDAPNIEWLRDNFPFGDVFILYGNHDNIDESHLSMMNPSSQLPCLLPHSSSVEVPLCIGDKDANTLALNSIPPNSGTDLSGVKSVPSAVYGSESAGENELAKPRVTVAPGMTKQERAEQYKKMTFQKKPKQAKKEIQERQWCNQNTEQALLADRIKAMDSVALSVAAGSAGRTLKIGAIHGIPSSHTQGLKKIERARYFRDLGNLCSSSSMDILMTHSNPRLPGQEGRVRGDDAPRIFDEFLRSTARMHLHGHAHTDPVVSVVAEGKVVVNSDCRVVAFVPFVTASGT
mmetsp:Transcript_21348/g.62215  ORF Transcript_21348/g.62215 Transcript_21348/m.62215 type:complete len:395 (-) Transcript_21348:1790-2974(-)